MKICSECSEEFTPRRHNQRFCSAKCKWTYTNRNRQLKPNVDYSCVVCGATVEKYVPPSDQQKNAFLYCSHACQGRGLSGENHPMWNGGRYVCDQGYVYLYRPDHPFVDKRSYVREHRLVMEEQLGRYLKPEEVVHHINGDTQDNRPENLQLFASNAEHKAHEMVQRRRDESGRMLPIGALS